jgi:hypothetical protein
MLRFSVSLLLTLVLSGFHVGSGTAAVAQNSDSSAHGQGDHSVTGGGVLPPGWTARPDDHGDIKDIKFVVMEPGYHITLGPATILYRETDLAAAPFHTLATFHQMKKTEHPEGYGLFVGGQNLKSGAQRYVYFLVRGDGKYLVKRRDGENTNEITKGWAENPAVKKVDAQGRATNLLEIDGKRDRSKVSFLVNGKTVYSTDARSLDLKGVVGLRVNHNLDVHVEGFAVHQ